MAKKLSFTVSTSTEKAVLNLERLRKKLASIAYLVEKISKIKLEFPDFSKGEAAFRQAADSFAKTALRINLLTSAIKEGQKSAEKGERRREVKPTSPEAVAKSTVATIKELSFLGLPLTNPTSPWAYMFAGRQLYSAMSGRAGGWLLGKMGMRTMAAEGGTAGAAGAAAAGSAGLLAGGILTGGILAAVAALGLSLAALVKMINIATEKMKESLNNISEAAQQGLNLRFYLQRNWIAQTLGVSNPNQVFAFGPLYQKLADQTNKSFDTISKLAPQLAGDALKLKLLQLRRETAYYKLSPFFGKVKLGYSEFFTQIIEGFSDFYSWLDKEGNNLVDKFFPPSQKTLPLKASKGGVSASEDQSKNLFGFIPPLMKQLPASQLEHMGLVIGGGVDRNQQISLLRLIENNTRMMAYYSRQALLNGYNQSNRKMADYYRNYYMGVNPVVNSY
jgi:hypothetical protein